MREEFEVWALNQRLEIKTDGASYYDHHTSDAWEAWKASRAAIEVELPAERKIRHLPRLDENTAYNEAIENCRDAIEAAGLKVKP